MENIPTDILPGFCMYPASAAALAATCHDLRGRLHMPFVCVEIVPHKMCIVKSNWYSHTLNIEKCCKIHSCGCPAKCCQVTNLYGGVVITSLPYFLITKNCYDVIIVSCGLPWMYGVNIPGMDWYRRGVPEDSTGGDMGSIIIASSLRRNWLTFGTTNNLTTVGAGETVYSRVTFSEPVRDFCLHYIRQR